MPRWCRIHFLLFAAQLDGLKITFFVKKQQQDEKFFSPETKMQAVSSACGVNERNWSTLFKRRGGSLAGQVNRF
jgi:hypothetical protein